MKHEGPFLRIALCQIRVGDDPDANAARVVRTIQSLKRRGVDLALFPEFALGRYPPVADGRPLAARAREAAARLGAVRRACRAARLGAAVGAPVPTRRGVFNAALLLSPAGRLLGRTDKAHLTGTERPFLAPAAARPPVLRFRGVPVGIQICFDTRFPEGFRHLAEAGAQVILVPFNARGKTPWKRRVLAAHLASRAAENGVYVAGVNNARPPQLVASHAFRPDGTRIVSAPSDREAIRVFAADLSKVSRAFLKRRRRDLYG